MSLEATSAQRSTAIIRLKKQKPKTSLTWGGVDTAQAWKSQNLWCHWLNLKHFNSSLCNETAPHTALMWTGLELS